MENQKCWYNGRPPAPVNSSPFEEFLVKENENKEDIVINAAGNMI
jgi:hypothetical protein